jgi:3-hydroxybutyryl-CoA dehydrogenase
MPNNQTQVNFEPEFYPIDRLLVVGPLADAKPFAGRADRAGHSVTMMLPDEEIENAHVSHRVLASGEAVDPEEFDLVLELHCADLESKAEALLYLEDAVAENIPIVTLTLAISAGELSRDLLIPERIVGVSILPPFQDSRFVELMRTPHTTHDMLRTADRFFESIGFDKENRAEVGDCPGGVLARTVCCLVNEAALAVQEGIASAEDIDRALRLASGFPFGPLSWGDRIGLERVLTVMEGLHAEFKEERYRPAPQLKRLVRAGLTGVAAGTGFFEYVNRG